MYSRGHSVAVASVFVWAGVVVTLAQGQGSHVSGHLATHDGRQLTSAALSLRSVADATVETPMPDIVVRPDGSFTFQHIPAGEYMIRARGDVDTHGPTRFGTFRIRVDNRDIDHVVVALVPGGQIDGRVVLESAVGVAPSELLRGVRVRAPLVDDRTFGDSLTGDVQPDGRYAIRGVMAGNHMIVVEGLRDPWVLKAVTWRGRDITAAGVQVESRQVYSDVRVTITDRSGVATASLPR